MKKYYGKPDIYFDNFTMCTSIAGNCDVITNTSGGGVCGLEETDTITIFTNGVTACTFKVGNSTVDAEYNGICYDVPIGNITTTPGEGSLFNS